MTAYNVAVTGSPCTGSHGRQLAKSQPIAQGVGLQMEQPLAPALDIEGINVSDKRRGPAQSCHLERVPYWRQGLHVDAFRAVGMTAAAAERPIDCPSSPCGTGALPGQRHKRGRQSVWRVRRDRNTRRRPARRLPQSTSWSVTSRSLHPRVARQFTVGHTLDGVGVTPKEKSLARLADAAATVAADIG
jgi:hypothetical protein